ncbi:MAG: FAD-dependent oxidoreductase [Candidatus Woesearchaeota archaeon]
MAAVKLLEIINASERIKVFRFEKPPGFEFIPGQFVILSTDNLKMESGLPLKRAYSIASSRDASFLDFCVALASETGFSHHLHNVAKPGEMFNLEGPFGKFDLQLPLKTETVFVAGGTGISSIRSMIDTLRDENFSVKVWLFYGIRSPEEFLFKDEWSSIGPNFQVVPAISDTSSTSWNGERGFISDVMARIIKDGKGKELYMCGPPKMIETTLAKAREIGFSEESIHREQW